MACYGTCYLKKMIGAMRNEKGFSQWIWPAAWAWKYEGSANQSFLQKSFKHRTFPMKNVHGKVNKPISTLCDGNIYPSSCEVTSGAGEEL